MSFRSNERYGGDRLGVRFGLEARFNVMGSIWQVSSNAQEVLDAMHEVFPSAGDASSSADLLLALHVDFNACKLLPRPRPHFRALDHLYYANYGPRDSMVVDQRNRQVLGHFSLATARDLPYWKNMILPCLVGIVSASVRITPVHCACVVTDGLGLLLGGTSGSGKSTLAVALSQRGFAYLSDDCTYLSRSGADLQAWGLPIPAKLLPDAVTHFPVLGGIPAQESLNGEMALQIDPGNDLGAARSPSCKPRWLVFVQRVRGEQPKFHSINSREAADRLIADLEVLPESIADQREYQLATIYQLVESECSIFRHGTTPDLAARALEEFCKG